MPRKDPRIVVLEDDLTTAGVAASSTDVVFVPGFANTNRNYLIYKKSGQFPDKYTPGTPTSIDANINNISDWNETQEYPKYACNTVDQITWRCEGVIQGQDDPEPYYKWTEQDVYIEPCPENVPVLCATKAAFETYFGKAPYQFDEDQDVSDLFDAKAGAVAKGAKYMYKAGDYEKSYIYAKELVSAGLPVVYENIVDRGADKNLDISSKAYVRNREAVVISAFHADRYEDIISDAATVAHVANAVNVDGAIQWQVNNVDVTSVFEFVDATKVVSQDIINISAKVEGEYATRYIERAEPTLNINESVLTSYMEAQADEKESLSYAEAIQLVYDGTNWQKLIIVDGEQAFENADLATYGFSLSDTNLVLVNDRISVVASYVETFNKKTPTVRYLYEALADCYTNEDKLRDKGEFSVKYITSGAYPVYELAVGDIVGAMIDCAYKRGDAFAIIDHTNNPERSLKATDGSGSVYAHIKKTEDSGIPASDVKNTFATMFTPWATYTCSTAPAKHEVQLMPASFAYLMGMAQSIVTHPNWLAIAGVNRGITPTIRSLNTVERLTNTIADSYQPRDERAINAITNIKPYGLTIWGNRTLVSNADGNLTGKSFLNIRSLICDIKKVAYTAAKSLLFEQNTEILWNKFKTQLTPTLDKMVHGYGLSSYKIIKATTKYDGTPLAKGEIAAVIRIVPIYAVEDFEITVVMTDEGVEVN